MREDTDGPNPGGQGIGAQAAGAQGTDAQSAEAEALAGKLAGYPGPVYRKAYLANLLQSGIRFGEAGNLRGARYCFSKVAEGLEEFPAETSESHPDPESPEAASAQDSAPTERKPRAPRAKPKEKPVSPTERFRRQWRLERLKDAENVLNKHAGRLSSLENQSYRERLEKLRQSGQSATTAVQSDKADAGLLDLRRRLYQRVLKSQKISLARQRMPVTLARLALPPAQPGLKSPGPNAGIRTNPPVPSSKVRVDTEWQPVTGPYNDRYNMEDLLSLIADADAAWVQEFLDLYRGLARVQSLVSAIPPPKK